VGDISQAEGALAGDSRRKRKKESVVGNDSASKINVIEDPPKTNCEGILRK
jgi:hypothetical protein